MLLGQLKIGMNDQLQPAPPLEEHVAIRPADGGRVSIREVAKEVAQFKDATRILGQDAADELVHKVNSAVEWYQVRTK